MEKNIKVYVVVIIVIILLAIFGFILITRDVTKLVDYINYTATLISLVLGLIAIFYSIITNQQSSDNFARLSDVVRKMEESATVIRTASNNIDDKLENMKNEIINSAQKGKGDIHQSRMSLTNEDNSQEANTVDDNRPDENE